MLWMLLLDVLFSASNLIDVVDVAFGYAVSASNLIDVVGFFAI